MEIANKSKWQLRIAILLIFALGFVAGALSFGIYRSWYPVSLSESRAGRGRFDQVLDSLKLTSEQRTQVEKILDDARTQLVELRRQSEPGMREVRQQTDQRLQAVLTAEQWEQFKGMRDEMRNRRRRGRGMRDNSR